MLRIVWFDSSDRNTFLEDILEPGGRWIPGRTTILGATHLCVHHSDFARNDAYSKAFKEEISKIEAKSAPLIIVYSGDPEVAWAVSAVSHSVEFFENLSLNVLALYSITSREDVVALKQFLTQNAREPRAQGESFDNIRESRLQQGDVKSAIDLVAEVVAWLSVMEVPHEMKEIRARLKKEFGEKGDDLVMALVDTVTVEVRDRVSIVADQKKTDRVEAWKKAGML